MPSFTTNQKIALAVSVPVAGILLYVLLRWAREDDEIFVDDGHESAEEADEFTASADLVSEFQIEQSHVGAVIGRGGSIIRQIQKDSQTRINFKDDDPESGDEASEEAKLPKQRERTILIRGSRERIKQAEVLIQKIIDEQPVLQKAKVEIPRRLIGRIIGKGGKTIRQLCRASGAKIKIDHDNEMGEVQTCDIVGTEMQIECAKQLIDEKISEDKAFRAKKNSTQDAKDKLTFAHLPSDDDYFGVYMSAMDTPGHFWLQNVTKNSKQLDDLVEEMTQFYGDRGEGHRLIPPKVGDLCCTTFQHDESWYRGEIVEVLEESSQVRLHYLDFGDTGVVPMSNVKEIRKEFCYLPFQAIECYLANVKPKDGKWSREACEAFEKLSCCAQWKVLMARVVYYDENGVPCVQLFDTTGEQDVNIEKMLVEKGFAEEKKDARKTSNSSFESSDAAVEQIIAEQKESTLEQMNEQFSSPAFENVSFGVDRSESFEFSSPIGTSSRLNDKEIVNEPTITPVEHQVVSCADISQLGALFGKLNVDSNSSIKDGEGLGNSKASENSSGEPYLDEKDSGNTPVEAQDGSVFMNNALNNMEGDISENFIEEFLEQGLEAAGYNSENDRINLPEQQENSEKDHIAPDQVSRNSEEVLSEIPITSSVADNAQESYPEQSLAFSDSLFTDHVVTESTFEEENLPDSAAMDMLKDNENRKNDELAMIKDVFNIPSENDNPVTSIPEYYPNQASETTVKPMPTGCTNRDEQNIGTLENGTDRADYVLRRSCSEDLSADDTLTNGAVTKSSSEISVSPSKDVDNVNSKTQLSSRSLGSLLSFPKGGKRVLAANFGQIPSHAKPESDHEDDEDDDDSIYLSAKEDSDSTGFLSAIGSRSNLRIDTDSDATPSGYLSEPEDSPIEVGATAVDAQARLDTTLLVEKLEQYADK